MRNLLDELAGHSNRWLKIAGLILYAFPTIAVIVIASLPYLAFLAPLLLGIFLVYVGSNLKAVDESGQKSAPKLSDIEIDDTAVEKIKIDYQVVSAEARFYDKYINRTTYLSLAIIGVLLTILLQTSQLFHPGITMVGSTIHFLFTVAIASYTEARKQLWNRQSEIENHPEFEGQLTVRRSVRPRESRGFFSKFSFSDSSLLMHYLLLVIWIGAYVFTLYNITCSSCIYDMAKP